MKNILLIFILIIGGTSLFFFLQETEPTYYPQPTTIISSQEEDGNNQIKREEWMEQMHRAAPSINWRAIEYRTQKERHKKRVQNAHFAGNLPEGELEVLADGRVTGTWIERGSLNQAGSVFDAEYDQETDEIWLLSAGGTLWKGPRDGSDWQVVNQDFKFSHGLLKFVSHNGGRRLISAIQRVPHYSDDEGITWTATEGLPINDNWGNIRHSVVLNDSLNSIYLISKRDYWANTKIFKSIDKGESFNEIHDFGTNEFNYSVLCNPHHSNDLYLIEKSDPVRFSKIDLDADTLITITENPDFTFGNTRANLIGSSGNATVWFYAYNNNAEVFRTENFGETWELRGQIEDNPWSVGMYVSPTNPDALFSGAVDCHKSLDGGLSWFRVNNWWEYYNNVEHKLHADMMDFNEYQTADGQKFLLVSNHGGLNISFDDLASVDNIGLSGLNVAQYYSVRTNQSIPYWVYAGSQDQGFQRANIFGVDEAADFEQVISGDYGHIVMTDNGDDLWTTYPGGAVSYYNFTQSGGPSAGWTMESDNESVWLPPLMAAPWGQNSVYMAGGNINGGEGSYLVKLQLDPQNQIIASQGTFDFRSNAGGNGVLSALEHSELNPDKFYAATSNGRFFYSEDGGLEWDQGINNIPGGHYLYGQSIYASKIDTNTVFLAGSGYSNPPVYISTNGGKFFTPMDEGLPPTLVFEITGNEDESLLFAATEAGPFVYVFQDEKWYDLSGACAPVQTYWSVEYVREFNVVRFGTYGRGIWDFEIEEIVNTKEENIVKKDFKIYPNPTAGIVKIEFDSMLKIGSEISLFNVSGRLLKNYYVNNLQDQSLNLSEFGPGTYFLSLEVEGERLSKKVFVY